MPSVLTRILKEDSKIVKGMESSTSVALNTASPPAKGYDHGQGLGCTRQKSFEKP